MYLLPASVKWGITGKIESNSSPHLTSPSAYVLICSRLTILVASTRFALVYWYLLCAGGTQNWTQPFTVMQLGFIAVRHTAELCSRSCPPELSDPFLQSCFPVSRPPACPGARIASSQVQESALALIKLHKVPAGTVLQHIAVPLNHSPACLPAHQLLPSICCHPWNSREYAQSHKSIWWTSWFMYCQPLKTQEV